MAKGLLIDTTRCIGCRACQVACKQWNGLEAEETEFFEGSPYQNPRDLSENTYLVIQYFELENEDGGEPKWVFSRRSCMHCIDPACVSACIVGALTKSEEGPVVYDPSKCIGCRYCMMSCPWEIPKYQWLNTTPQVRKCVLCHDRIAQGLQTACAQACPTDAITFGERDDLVETARKRIADGGGKYIDHIYGLEEAGGTSVLRISDVPMEKIGFRPMSKEPRPHLTAGAMHAIPGVIVGASLLLGGSYAVIKRRMQVQPPGEAKSEKSRPSEKQEGGK
jgi:formate dehydrogenase iron-sulfur subunit